MSDSFSSTGLDSFDNKSASNNNDLEEFIVMAKQEARYAAQIHQFSDLCWDKCIDKPSSKLDGRSETCLVNCVNRFIDVSVLIATRMSQLITKSAQSS